MKKSSVKNPICILLSLLMMLSVFCGIAFSASASASLVGTWKNDNVIYTFNAGGTGSTEDPATGTGTPFTYEVAADQDVVTISFGSPDDSEAVAYAMPDENTLVLSFESGAVTLSRAAKTAFPTGTWKNEDVIYTFNADGTGSTEDPTTGTGTPFTYEVAADQDVVTISFGSPDDSEAVAYAMPDENTLVLSFASGAVTLTRSDAASESDENKCPLCGKDHTGRNGLMAVHYVMYFLTVLFRDWLPKLIKK